jgi:nitroimidazol reductase NimA-like FMN-containing flavoprotein (pyridoxamine 5'-phosphate oxidase superfamily)
LSAQPCDPKGSRIQGWESLALRTLVPRLVAGAASASQRGTTAGMEPTLEELTEAESLQLIEQAEIGRIGFSGRYGPVITPVNYKIVDGSVVFRTAVGSPLGEDLRTGIAHAEYKVAFEIDDFSSVERTGWSVLVQGSAHHVDSEAERASMSEAGVEAWPGGDREAFLRIIPSRITGRRIR